MDQVCLESCQVNEYGFRLGGLDMAEMVNFTFSLLEGDSAHAMFAGCTALVFCLRTLALFTCIDSVMVSDMLIFTPV